MTIDRAWFERDAPIVAPELLGKRLVAATTEGVIVAGRIIEVEAYTRDDPASHTFRGQTPRNSVMFGPAGHAYVYISYGIHRCLNVVTGATGDGQAVLIRAVEVLDGLETVVERRAGRSHRELTNGPGKVGEAFAIDLSHNGLDLLDSRNAVHVADDGTPPPVGPVVGPRIGITEALERPWRFRVPPVR